MTSAAVVAGAFGAFGARGASCQPCRASLSGVYSVYARGSAFRTKSEGATESHARGPSCTGRAVEDVSIGAGPRRARERPSCSGPRSSAGPVPPRRAQRPRAPLEDRFHDVVRVPAVVQHHVQVEQTRRTRGPPELLRQLRRERPHVSSGTSARHTKYGRPLRSTAAVVSTSSIGNVQSPNRRIPALSPSA